MVFFACACEKDQQERLYIEVVFTIPYSQKYKILIIESMLVICALKAHCTRFSYDIIREYKQLPLQAEHVEEKYQESELFPRRQASM